MSKRSRQPERRKSTGAIVVATILVILVAVVAGVYRMSSASGSGNGAASITLDPNIFTGEVHQAYLVAQQHPDLLAQLDCYCGCEQHEGHKNLLDCFRTNHGAGCAICSGEAVMAGQLAESGTPVDQIRKILYQRYGHAHMHGG